MLQINNIFEQINKKEGEELFEEILSTKNIRVERIISEGESSPENFWYNQNTNELVFLISGKAELSFKDGTKILLNPGDYLLIPANTQHRVEWTCKESKTIWIAIHY